MMKHKYRPSSSGFL